MLSPTEALREEGAASLAKSERPQPGQDVAANLLATLRAIQEVARPGQEMGVSDAIDALCDVWNLAGQAIAKAEGQS